MLDFWRQLFATDFMPHGYCLRWASDVVWLHVISDALTALSYYVIPIALVYFVRRRKDLAFHWMFLLFGVFILACGTTHAMSIYTLWEPVYRLDGLIKAITAAASVLTAILLVRLMPQLLAIPSPAQLHAANAALESEIGVRRQAEAETRRLNEELERRVRERTAELAESNRYLRLALEAAQAVAYEWNVEAGRAVRTQNAAAVMGLTSAESSDFTATIHPDDREQVTARLGEATGQEHTYRLEYRIVRPDSGEVRWIEHRGHVVEVQPGRTIRTGILMDVTPRKQAEDSLRRSETRFRTLVEAMPQLVWTARPDGSCDYVSSQWVQYCGLPEEQLHGDGRFACIHPEDRERVVAAYHRSIAAGADYEAEYRLRRHDGLYRWFKVRGVPVRDASTGIMQWLGTATDINDQKQTENELRKANASLEEFAYVTSHDLQEPLRMVNLYTQLLLRHVGAPDQTAAEFGSYVQSGVRRMQRLIDDLLSFSRVERVDSEPGARADLQEALADAESVLRERLNEAGGTLAVATPLPTVPGEASRYAQVFQNLLANSLKYCRAGVAPHIVVSAERDGDYWVIAVADNGEGFEPHYAERIFGLFKRLHGREVEGTGIGLAVCRKLIERLGGTIWAEGRPGEGATFRFRVPAEVADSDSVTAA